MKKLIFGLGIMVAGLTCSVATAQDYYSYQPGCCPDQFDPCCCDTEFDGFYIGGNLGVITNVAHRNDLDGFLTDNAGWSFIDTDFTIGLQVGWDWQCGCSLFGVVVDWNWVNIDRRVREEPNDPNDDNFIRNEVDWFTTIRARAGLTVCDCLIYLTAGAAVTEFDVTWQDAPDRFHRCDTEWGWTAGVGVEYLMGCSFSLGAEFLFMHFDHDTHSFTNDVGTTFSFGHSDSLYVGRIFVNYRLGDLFSCFCR